ncbi:major facilitator superfamily domain-containing protein [Lentinula lateritia]|uniref:Major facilitator superfamily domain-containing protein n=1 Tax=Lentinula lateritia TaxID=40482 RepID=A0ABQ8V8M5_9AGAR|nr:major facilitator superfamily domain-containing protein [Lentinula lateritia]
MSSLKNQDQNSINSTYSAEAKYKRSWGSYIWDTWDKSPEERRFLTKLDSYQQNITNAYVSGMQEDLHLVGNDLNYITTAWTCGYVIGQIPSNLLITRIRPSLWIPAMEVLWSVLTVLLSTSKNFTHLVVIRFFVGLAESTFYPAMQYVIGSWYKTDELGKRACIFHVASAIGPMFSGFLQTAAYNGLNEVHGLAGWKWLFIIDGIITIPIALLGFLVMPDLPNNTRPSKWLYTEAQLEIANKRMAEINRKPPSKFTKAKILGFFTTWHIYTLVPLYILFNNGGGPASSMIFWLKSFNTPTKTVYTVGQINIYPLGQNVVQVHCLGPGSQMQSTWSMIICILLAVTPLYTHIARRWALYYMTTVPAGMSGLILAWANELTGADSEKRSFVVASCNMWAYVMQAWLPMWNNPVFFAFLTYLLQRRDARRQRSLEKSQSTPDNGIRVEGLPYEGTELLIDVVAGKIEGFFGLLGCKAQKPDARMSQDKDATYSS